MPEKGRIWASAGKGRIRASTGKVESRLVPEKGKIRASAGKVEIRVSAEKGQNPGECWKRVESGRV